MKKIIISLAILLFINAAAYSSDVNENELLFGACNDYKCGVINLKNEVIIPFEYSWIQFDPGTTKSDNKYFVASKPKDGIFNFTLDDDKYGIIDNNGNVILKFKYDYMHKASNQVFRAKIKDKRVYINIKGNIVDPPQNNNSNSNKMIHQENLPDELIKILQNYDSYSNFDTAFLVRKGNTQGVIDNQGKIIIPLGNKSIYLPKYGLYKVKNEDKTYAFYDLKGNIVGKYDAEFANIITDNLIQIGKMRNQPTYHNHTIYNVDEGIVDTKGNTIIPITYDRLEYYDTGFFIATKDSKIGIYNEHGEIVIPFGKYDAFCLENGVFTKEY